MRSGQDANLQHRMKNSQELRCERRAILTTTTPTSAFLYVFSGFFAFLICARLWFAGPFFSLFGSPAIVRFFDDLDDVLVGQPVRQAFS